ncbi:40S ribosomal protein S24 [Dissostichus eleginoides]|uniref:40S ribosomal protein S24 n=1 Tax=Dissostichus eleginoides TaxID=100907 RepID=A0AAD9FBM6_DISEL|nr:40S ribosomal protein S24 [Dissostichus eleginoides]
MMERRKSKLQNILEDDLGRDLMNAGRFCFSCEQIFANRKCLEEHFCSAASHICSCGTEFAEYNDVLDHSTTHEPGHQVLDHGTIQKRRIEKRIEEEQQLKRLQTGEVVWKVPKLNNVPSVSLLGTPLLKGPMTSALMPQVPMQSAQISQVPPLNSSLSQTPVLIKPSEKDMQNIFAGNPHPRASNNGSRGLPVPHFVQLKTPTQSASGVSNYPMQTSSASNGFPCRVCHLPFESAQLLQRHKCARAKEFMAQHVRDGKQYRLKRVAPLTRPIPVLMNGERKPGVSAYGNIKTNQVMSGSLNKGQGAAPVDGETGGDMDDDCFIVESGPDKPAEMIYQVTSSVPITT